MTTENLILIFACFLAFVTVLVAQQMWVDASDAFNAIDYKFKEDFENCRRAIQSYPRDADVIIDGFEDRWKPYIEANRFNYYVGKLIEKQFQNQ